MHQEKSQFKKVLNTKDVLVLAFGAMIGWGWVVLTGDWIGQAGSVGAMIAFAIGGLLVTLVGLTYAELTSAMPKTGGEHVFSYRGLGINASFICTWALILGYISVVAFEAVALPTVIEYLLPNFKQGFMWNIAGWDVYASWVLVGVVGSIFMTVINYFGIKTAAFIQLVFTILLAAIGGLFISGSLVVGQTANMQPLFTGGIVGTFSVLVMAPLMLVGFDVIPQAAEEINIPLKKIGRILILSVVLAALWYVGIILGVSRALSLTEIQNSTMVTADAMSKVFNGSWAGKLLIIAGIGGILTSWNSFFIGGSRAIYAMAHSKMLPSFLGKIHPKYNTPTNAILLIGLLSSIAPFFGRKTLVWLVDAGGLAVVMAYLMVSLSFLVLRYKEPNMPRPFKVAYGKTVGIGAVILSTFFILLYLPGVSPAALVWPYEWAIAGGWIILGVVFYIWARVSYGNVASDIMKEETYSKDVFVKETLTTEV